jgi:hypothetical protein
LGIPGKGFDIMPVPVLTRLGLSDQNSGAGFGQWIADPAGTDLASINPADGQPIARVKCAAHRDYEVVVDQARQPARQWL